MSDDDLNHKIDLIRADTGRKVDALQARFAFSKDLLDAVVQNDFVARHIDALLAIQSFLAVCTAEGLDPLALVREQIKSYGQSGERG